MSASCNVEEHRVGIDLVGLMQQLGAIPEPEHSEGADPAQQEHILLRPSMERHCLWVSV